MTRCRRQWSDGGLATVHWGREERQPVRVPTRLACTRWHDYAGSPMGSTTVDAASTAAPLVKMVPSPAIASRGGDRRGFGTTLLLHRHGRPPPGQPGSAVPPCPAPQARSWSLRWRSVLADERTGGRPAVSSIRRTRRRPSSISWTRGVKYLPDLYTDFYYENCKRYVCTCLPHSLAMSSGIRPQPWGLMPFAGKAIIPG
jgi:hypothetical protein